MIFFFFALFKWSERNLTEKCMAPLKSKPGYNILQHIMLFTVGNEDSM